MNLSQFSWCLCGAHCTFYCTLCLVLRCRLYVDKFCSIDKDQKPRLRNIRRKWNGVLWCHLFLLLLLPALHVVAVCELVSATTHTQYTNHCYWSFTSWVLLSFYFNTIYLYFISTILFSHNTLISVSPGNYP